MRRYDGGLMTSHSPAARAALILRLRTAGSVFAEEEADLLLASASSPGDLDRMVGERVGGTPLEYVLGWAEFLGLRIAVRPGVFVPRRRTEFLATETAALCSSESVVVDLCCGSGAVGAALLSLVPGITLHAADIDPAAVECAALNLADRGGHVHQGDLFDALPSGIRGSVNVLVANAPYVPTDSIALMPPEARLHEARVALDGGRDGLDVQRRVAAQALSWLAPGGALVVETSDHQAPVTAAIFAAHGLTPAVASSPAQSATIVVGRAPDEVRRRATS